jgi:tRNA/tmRNA/rRNA uracil-C5-methylase (TrmA/RlmC/RlmD family)
MSKRGDAGVAKVEGLVIFVTGTKVGDNVKIKITKVGRGYATAEIAGSDSAASERSDEQSSTPLGDKQAGDEQPSTLLDDKQAGDEQPSTPLGDEK